MAMLQYNQNNFDDYVYEDSFYTESIKKDEEILNSALDIVFDEDSTNEEITIVCLCEDCNNRWYETKLVSEKNLFCKRCGSDSVVDIS